MDTNSRIGLADVGSLSIAELVGLSMLILVFVVAVLIFFALVAVRNMRLKLAEEDAFELAVEVLRLSSEARMQVYPPTTGTGRVSLAWKSSNWNQ